MALLQLLTVLAVAGYASSNVVNTTATKSGNFELLILHNNDMHARFEQTSQLSGTCTPADRDAGKCYGGFPRVAYVVKEARKAAASGQGPPVLYLNAGDTYTGTAWFTLYKWKIAAEFINALEPDAVSLGNHEFDDGVSGLTPFIENLTSPVLAANLNLNKEPTLQAETNLMDSIIFNINGTKVGIVGYLTPETKVLAIPNHVEYIDEVTALREEVAKFKQDGVKIIIALGHSGWAKDLQIAKEVEGLDLVIGGHTNTFLWNGAVVETEDPIGPYPFTVKQKNGRSVPVVQAYAYTKYLGKLHLIFDPNGEIISYDGNPIILNKDIPQDPDVLKIINKYKADVDKVTDEVVGNSAVRLEMAPCKTKECNLGNVITDAMVYRYMKDYRGGGWTDAPIAIVQKGGIRAGIVHPTLPTNVTMGDLLTVLPFGNSVVVKTLNGSSIWAMLEYSVSKHTKTSCPGFLHLSGMKVVYDFHKRPFMRVVKVYIRCSKCDVPEYMPINKTKNYNVLMTSFLSMGGDGFDMFLNKITRQLPYTDLDTLVTYFRDESPIYTGLEDRITVYNLDRLKSSASGSSAPLICIVILCLISLLI